MWFLLRCRYGHPLSGNARSCETMVKKACQAAVARNASSSLIVYIQMSDIDADFDNSDPLTLLDRFKVSLLFIVFVGIICLFSTMFALSNQFFQRLMETHSTIMSRSSQCGLECVSKRRVPKISRGLDWFLLFLTSLAFAFKMLSELISFVRSNSLFTTRHRRAIPASGTCCFSAIRALARPQLRSRWASFCMKRV